MRIATGEEVEELDDDVKDPVANALCAQGGKKRDENITPEWRAKVARKAAESCRQK